MKTYLRILSFARPFRRFVPQYIIFTLLAIVFSLVNFALLIPLLEVLFNQVDAEVQQPAVLPEFALTIDYLKSIFNYYFNGVIAEHGKVGALIFVCSITIVSVFFSNLFRYVSELTLAKLRADVVRNLRNRIFDQVSRLHIGYFTNERKGDLLSRITNDVQEVETSVVNTLKVAFRDPATIIGFFLVLFTMSVKLTIFTLVFLPITGGIIAEVIKRLKKRAVQSQESLGRIVNILDETLSGMRVVKAFNAENFIRNKFGKEVDNYAHINISMAKKQQLASPMSEFLGASVMAGILLYGGILVLNNSSELSASEFITYIVIFSQVMAPAKSINQAFSSIQRGLAAGERIFSTIDTQVVIQDKPEAETLQAFHEQIEFRNVYFAYEKENVLKNINLEIPKGKTIALVGPSGGGKSTLADLIPRFYDPTSGEVLLDGKSLKDYQVTSVRGLMGIVTQESILFNDTIFNNIAFGVPHASLEDVMQAAKIANAHQFIMETPHQYETVIGERGTKLSGGQRQRLSIARAVLKNPPILILDEATSALDSESEKLVQEALTNLMKNRTSVVIAHRLSTIQHADEIVVVQDGEIIERGSHNELLEQDGLYRKLSSMQAV